LVKDGDEITIDTTLGRLDLHLPTNELEERRMAWKPKEPKYKWGALAKYASLVSSASEGAICAPI
jgi:dihydroxy-acid dehydratase